MDAASVDALLSRRPPKVREQGVSELCGAVGLVLPLVARAGLTATITIVLFSEACP